MKEYKRQAAFAIIGLATTLVGLTFKLNHLMYAHEIFNVGITILVVGLLWWGIKLIKNS